MKKLINRELVPPNNFVYDIFLPKNSKVKSLNDCYHDHFLSYDLSYRTQLLHEIVPKHRLYFNDQYPYNLTPAKFVRRYLRSRNYRKCVVV